jgi:EpsI family protein
MRFGPGAEHITFGMIFFIVVMLLMFWIGRRWQDEFPERDGAGTVCVAEPLRRSIAAWLAPLLALVVLVTGPVFLESSIARAQARLTDTPALIRMPAAVEGWHGPQEAAGRWRPQYRGGLVEQQVLYTDANDEALDVFVAVYGLGATLGAEMISYSNVIDPQEYGSLAPETTVRVPLAVGNDLTVRELTIRVDGADRVVWHWYLVGDRPVANPFVAKALEAAAFVTRGADSERIVTLSTTQDAAARERLQAFVLAHGDCVAAGFAVEGCGG